MKNRLLIYISTVLTLAAVTIIVIFIARGYVVSFEEKGIKKTGMILAQSTPSEARVFLDGKLIETTNAVLDTVPPGIHQLKLEKEGFSAWEKEIEVYSGLITEINALLVPTSPRLTPLTNSGIVLAATSPSGEKIAYTSRKSDPAGLWVLNLTGQSFLDVVQENPYLVAKDTGVRKFSLAEEIIWEPEEKELLVTLNPRGHVVIPLRNGRELEATNSAQPTITAWQAVTSEQKEKWARRIDLKNGFEELAIAEGTIWSPNKKRFLYKKEIGDYFEWHVYNGIKPLGVGKRREYIPLKTKKDENASLVWHSSSNHLILQKENSISVLNIDGTNKKEVYSGELQSSFKVCPTPDGANIVILTSFQQNGSPNLYTIGLR